MIEYALSEGVDLVLFCGDAYQRKDPTQTYQREFARRLLKLSQAGIPVVLVPGNHDLHPAPGKASSVDIFSVLSTAPIYTSHRPQLFNIPTRSGNVQVLSIPWLWRSSLTAKEEYRAMSFDELNQEMSRIVADMVSRESQKIDGDGKAAVLACHLWVTGSKLGSEQHYVLERDYSLLPAALALPVFDYVALGHIHSKQSFDLDPPVAYAGSLERIDFGDEGVPKGFYLVEIDQTRTRAKREVKHRFIEQPARQFVTLDINILPEDTNPTSSLMLKLDSSQKKISDAVVKVIIHWPFPHQLRPPESEVRKALKGAFLIAGVRWETAPSGSSRLQNISSPSTLNPLEALEEYLKVRKVGPRETAELRSYAEKLLKEIEPS